MFNSLLGIVLLIVATVLGGVFGYTAGTTFGAAGLIASIPGGILIGFGVVLLRDLLETS